MCLLGGGNYNRIDGRVIDKVSPFIRRPTEAKFTGLFSCFDRVRSAKDFAYWPQARVEDRADSLQRYRMPLAHIAGSN